MLIENDYFLLDKFFQRTRSNYENQRKVVDLLLDADMKSASNILFSKAIPNQKAMVLTIK